MSIELTYKTSYLRTFTFNNNINIVLHPVKHSALMKYPTALKPNDDHVAHNIKFKDTHYVFVTAGV